MQPSCSNENVTIFSNVQHLFVVWECSFGKITLKTSLRQFLFELNLTSVRVVVHITQEEKVDEGLISFG